VGHLPHRVVGAGHSLAGRCTGVILAGGRATRYGGQPKGLERIGGVRIIDRVAAALRQASDALLLIANDPGAATWLPGTRAETDIWPDAGSLGGIHAALMRAGTPVLIVAWDMPFVPAGLLRLLRALGQAGADAAVPVSRSRRGIEPLCAYYAPACIGAIERCLAAGERRAIAFLDDVRVSRLDAAQVGQFGDPDRLFLNVNSPADLSRAEQIVTTPSG